MCTIEVATSAIAVKDLNNVKFGDKIEINWKDTRQNWYKIKILGQFKNRIKISGQKW